MAFSHLVLLLSLAMLLAGLAAGQSHPPPPPPPAACTLLMPGRPPSSFAACLSVLGIGTNFSFLWTLRMLDPSDSSSGGQSATLELGLQAAAGDGWVAVGFPQTPGFMLGATAMVLKRCQSCSSPQQAGAVIQDYFLAAKAVEGVRPPGHLPVSGAAAAATTGSSAKGDIDIAGTISVG